LKALRGDPSEVPHDSETFPEVFVGAEHIVRTSSTIGLDSSDVPFAGLGTTGMTLSPASGFTLHPLALTTKRPLVNSASHAFAAAAATFRASARITPSVGWTSLGTVFPYAEHARMIAVAAANPQMVRTFPEHFDILNISPSTPSYFQLALITDGRK
jgi:hypothetical protein